VAVSVKKPALLKLDAADEGKVAVVFILKTAAPQLLGVMAVVHPVATNA
jgi:hypothetical protein